MKKNFDMDAAIRRALRESIEAHAHEWEPKFNTGVGPVGDDAPFDKKVSGDVNEGKDCKDCCPKCGKCPCECDKVNEGTIPGDSHEWEPGFETGVGEVGDDNPFTQAVNESLTDTNDWEDGSFGAEDHKKEGIAFADGGDECGNGVVATSQKNSGRVESSDNLSEEADEEGKDEGIGGGLAALGKAAWNGVKKAGKAIANTYNRGSQAQDIRRDRRERDAGQAKVDAYNQKYGMNQATAPQQAQPEQPVQNTQSNAQPEKPAQDVAAKQVQPAQNTQPSAQPEKPAQDVASKPAQPSQNASNFVPIQQYQNFAKAMMGHIQKLGERIGKLEASQQSASNTQKASAPQQKEDSNIDPVTGKEAVYRESKEEEKDVIAEERDRFFNIINRIEKLYD